MITVGELQVWEAPDGWHARLPFGLKTELGDRTVLNWHLGATDVSWRDAMRQVVEALLTIAGNAEDAANEVLRARLA